MHILQFLEWEILKTYHLANDAKLNIMDLVEFEWVKPFLLCNEDTIISFCHHSFDAFWWINGLYSTILLVIIFEHQWLRNGEWIIKTMVVHDFFLNWHSLRAFPIKFSLNSSDTSVYRLNLFVSLHYIKYNAKL